MPHYSSINVEKIGYFWQENPQQFQSPILTPLFHCILAQNCYERTSKSEHSMHFIKYLEQANFVGVPPTQPQKHHSPFPFSLMMVLFVSNAKKPPIIKSKLLWQGIY